LNPEAAFMSLRYRCQPDRSAYTSRPAVQVTCCDRCKHGNLLEPWSQSAPQAECVRDACSTHVTSPTYRWSTPGPRTQCGCPSHRQSSAWSSQATRPVLQTHHLWSATFEPPVAECASAWGHTTYHCQGGRLLRCGTASLVPARRLCCRGGGDAEGHAGARNACCGAVYHGWCLQGCYTKSFANCGVKSPGEVGWSACGGAAGQPGVTLGRARDVRS
jgi:hypothetical protein